MFAVALVTRTAVVARSAGFDASYGYDQSVYYAASAALLHGRLPYSDFTLLHPPVVMLALLPAALLGHWTTDQAGYLVGNVSFAVIGALNAVLVVLVARRLGVRRSAALVGGLLYAVWFAAAGAEISARLEPLGNFFLLLALLALAGAAGRPRPARALVVAGALFGVAASVKIWFVVPLVVAVGWSLLRPAQRQRAGWVAAGALATGVLLNVPFLIASRGEMWTMVVNAQLERDTADRPVGYRLADLTTAYWPHPDTVSAALVITTVAATTLLVAVLALAWRVHRARVVVAVALAAVVTLLVVPAWYQQYPDFAAGPIAVCAAAAAQSLPGRVRLAGWVPVLGAGAVTLAVLVAGSFPATSWWGPDRLAVVAQRGGCVTSDTPAGLIALDVLDRDLGRGCPNWVDVIGHALLTDGGAAVPLDEDAEWQRDVAAYLRSGQLAYPYLLRRPLSPETLAQLRRGGIAAQYRDASGRRFTLYRVGPP